MKTIEEKKQSLKLEYLKNEFHDARNDDPDFKNLYKENEFMEYLIDQIESGCILLFNNFDVEE